VGATFHDVTLARGRAKSGRCGRVGVGTLQAGQKVAHVVVRKARIGSALRSRTARSVLFLGPEVHMDKKAVEKELVELEHRYWQALKDRDVAAVEQMTDDPCFVTGAQGVGKLDKKSLVAMMKAASYTLDEFELDGDIKVRMLGDDVAIVAYKVHEELTVDGEPVSLDAADASTWIRRKGRWVCALHTESLTGDPFGRDRRSAEQPVPPPA
jgi:hypothetical protein